jgi:hypothetical protein
VRHKLKQFHSARAVSKSMRQRPEYVESGMRTGRVRRTTSRWSERLAVCGREPDGFSWPWPGAVLADGHTP